MINSLNALIRFSDGEEAHFPLSDGLSVMASARAAGITMALDCRQGICQVCKCTRVEGAVSYEDRASLTLTESDEATGAFLPCVARATDSLVFDAPYERASLQIVKTKAAEVVSLEPIADSTVCVTVRFGKIGRIDFLPGQYFKLRLPDGQTRSYSMATSPAEWPVVKFLIRLVPGGKTGHYIEHTVKPGDKIEFAGPYGAFYLRNDAAPILMIAGGTGLAPLLSMFSALRARNDLLRNVVLCFGVTHEEALFYRGELDQLRDEFVNLDLRVAVQRPGPDWTGKVGSALDLVTDADIAAVVAGGHASYLCGPQGMVESATQRLLRGGAERRRIFAEEFLPTGSSATPVPA